MYQRKARRWSPKVISVYSKISDWSRSIKHKSFIEALNSTLTENWMLMNPQSSSKRSVVNMLHPSPSSYPLHPTAILIFFLHNVLCLWNGTSDTWTIDETLCMCWKQYSNYAEHTGRPTCRTSRGWEERCVAKEEGNGWSEHEKYSLFKFSATCIRHQHPIALSFSPSSIPSRFRFAEPAKIPCRFST